jgi:hypothetical protein
MASLLDQLRAKRTEAREAAAQIEQRAADEQRDLTPEELAEHGQHLTAEREASDQLDQLRDDQLAELRAAAVRRPGPAPARGPVLTREQSVEQWAQTRGLFEPGTDDRPPSFDRYLRGIVSGNWDGARAGASHVRRQLDGRRPPGPDAAVEPGHRPGPQPDAGDAGRRGHRPDDRADVEAGPADR